MSKKFFINDAEKIIPPVNDSPYKRILAIGDVHAAFDKLMSLWQKLDVSEGDRVVFLGDYLYGMNDKNLDTLRWLLEHEKRKNIFFLRGNSDDVSLQHLFNDQGKIFHGLNSRLGVAIKLAAVKNPYLPQEIFNFLNNLPLCHGMTIGGRKYFFCHAGINVNVPLEEQTKNYLVDPEPRQVKKFYCDYSGDAVIVVGHKSPKKIFKALPNLFTDREKDFDLTKPLKIPRKNILLLDTGAKKGGCISCVDILSGEIFQSDIDD